MSELNIEQERQEFECAYKNAFPEVAALMLAKLARDENDEYIDGAVFVAFGVWCAGKRISMGSAEPVVYVECGDGIVAHDPGVCGNCYAMKYRDAAPSDAKDARLHHLYDKQMAQLVKPCMSYNEWLNAIDVCISGDAAREPK